MNNKKSKKAATMIDRAKRETVPSTWGINLSGEKRRRRAYEFYRIDISRSN